MGIYCVPGPATHHCIESTRGLGGGSRLALSAHYRKLETWKWPDNPVLTPQSAVAKRCQSYLQTLLDLIPPLLNHRTSTGISQTTA